MNKEQFDKKRAKEQKRIVEKFGKITGRNMMALDAPTGSGKTHISIDGALEYRKNNHGAPIIISTNTNKLAKDILAKALENKEHFGITENDIVLDIGKANYLDLENLYKEANDDVKSYSFLFHHLSDIATKYITKNADGSVYYDNTILIEDFIEEFRISEENIGYIKRFAQDNLNTLNPKNIKQMVSYLLLGKIVITNHVYLLALYSILSGKNNRDLLSKITLFETAIIMDEFHSLHSSADTILNKTFSLYRLRYSCGNIKDKLPNKTICENLNNIFLECLKIEDAIRNEPLKNGKQQLAILKLSALKEKIGGKQKAETLLKAIDKELKKLETLADDNSIEIFKQEFTEFFELKLSAIKSTAVEFSPAGYPSIKLSGGVAGYSLNRIFWRNLAAPFFGLSGTLRTSREKSKEAFLWILIKNGIYKNDIEKIKESLEKKVEDGDMPDEVAQNIISRSVDFNNAIDNIQYEYMPYLFQKSRVLSCIVDKKYLTLPSRFYYVEDEENETSKSFKNEEFDKEHNQWGENVGRFIANNFRCNSLVLVISYKDVEMISNAITAQDNSIKVFVQNKDNSMDYTVKQYEAYIEGGKKAIIVGTEQYYTGLDLKGKKLEELYIARLPYGWLKGKTGKHINAHWVHTKSKNYFFEMYFKFMQGFGRLARDFEDSGVIYILGKQLHNERNYPLLEYINEKSILLKYHEVLEKRNSILDCKDTYKSAILGMFEEIFELSSLEDIVDILKIKEEDIVPFGMACGELLGNGFYFKDEDGDWVRESINKDNYECWNLLMKMSIKSYENHYEHNILHIAIEHNLFGCESFGELAKNIFFKNKYYKEIGGFCDYVRQ